MREFAQRLYQRQCTRATFDGRLDSDALALSICETYREYERDRRRIERATALMSDELNAANARLAGVVETLSAQNRRFEAALKHMSQGLCMFDAEQRVVVCNERFTTMFGLGTPDSLIGQRVAERIHALTSSPAAPGRDAAPDRDYLVISSSDEPSVWNTMLSDGRAIVIVHEAMAGGGFVQTFEDVTARHAAERRIVHLATHDVLTDLPNRRLLTERLRSALAEAPAGRHTVVLCLDLDRFKPVNDALGHAAGDQLLQRVTQRLRSCVRPHDTVARTGGDEFVLVLRVADPRQDVARIAQRVLRTLGEPFDLDGNLVQIGTSIGIAIAGQDASDPDRLLCCADMALYEAKREGGRAYRYFSREMERSALERRSLETDLRKAVAMLQPDAPPPEAPRLDVRRLDAPQFDVHYQPLLDIRQHALSGFEALVRWNCPTRGRVAPDQFIPLAEELGLIGAIGEWVLVKACAAAARWPAELSIAINVSAPQILEGSIVNAVDRALALSGIDAHRLELEITESVLLSDTERAVQVLHSLRQRGVRIVMDDFGTGYSSLAYLRRFPFDKVKIDRSFVNGLCDQTESMAIVRSIIGLCASLGIPSTAEGVETREQLVELEKAACTQAQGFLFSKPVAEDELPGLLDRYQETRPAPNSTTRPRPWRFAS